MLRNEVPKKGIFKAEMAIKAIDVESPAADSENQLPIAPMEASG